MEEIPFQRSRPQTTLTRIPGEEELIPLQHEIPAVDKELQVLGEQNNELITSMSMFNITAPRLTTEQEDIADLPTQKLETLSQSAKRSDSNRTAKRQLLGYITLTAFEKSQELAQEAEHVDAEEKKKKFKIPDIQISEIEQDKAPQKELSPDVNVETMLQKAGLAELPVQKPEEISLEQLSGRKSSSDSTETQLGSLDRTNVSHGDSVKTTDTQKFIRDEWGPEGTMIKIISLVRDNEIVHLPNLIARGPVVAGHKKIIVALCFTSLLKLKQHGFINITKNPETLEIVEITLGPPFDC